MKISMSSLIMENCHLLRSHQYDTHTHTYDGCPDRQVGQSVSLHIKENSDNDDLTEERVGYRPSMGTLTKQECNYILLFGQQTKNISMSRSQTCQCYGGMYFNVTVRHFNVIEACISMSRSQAFQCHGGMYFNVTESGISMSWRHVFQCHGVRHFSVMEESISM